MQNQLKHKVQSDGESQKKIKKSNYKEAGITLVALVVTIIVLLILAGITINLVLGNNGVMNRAQYASNTWANATADEETAMGQFANDVDSLTAGYINQNGVDYTEILQQYFNSPNLLEEKSEGVWGLADNNELGINANNFIFISGESEVEYYYLGSVYKVLHNVEYNLVSKIDTDFDINRFGEYIVDGKEVLNVPNKYIFSKTSSGNNIPIGYYFSATASEQLYFLDALGNPDFERPFIGYIVKAWGPEDDPFNTETIYYDINGNVIVDPDVVIYKRIA